MFTEYPITVVMVVSTFLVLCSASYSDHRSREVSDVHWAVIGGIGLLGNFLIQYVSGNVVPGVLFLISGSLFLASILGCFGKADSGFEAISLAIAGATAFFYHGNLSILACSVAVLFGGVYHLFYILGIVRGGADAKCLMAIGLVIPCYPVSIYGSIPDVPDIVTLVFAPSFSALFVASLVSVAGCMLFCAVKNIGSGSGLRVCLHTYSIPLEGAEKRFVWLVERPACSGEESYIPIDDQDVSEILEQFRGEGRENIRVTPMIPFIIPLTVGFVVTVLFGSPLFIL